MPETDPGVFELAESIYNLRDQLHELRKKQLSVLNEIIEAEDKLLALEEERMYVAAGVSVEIERPRCGGHCRGKNN